MLAHLQDQSKNKEEIFKFVMRAHQFLRKIELGGIDPKTKREESHLYGLVMDYQQVLLQKLV